MENQNKLAIVDQIKITLAKEYQNQIVNFFGDKDKALRFLSGVMDSIQRNPELQGCTPVSLINSFMIMASLKFMPSAISGEAYVLPYKTKNGTVAQFQLGYQGIITLLYKAGAKSVTSEIVRKNDKFSIVNNEMVHEINPLMNMKERGDAIGAYAIIALENGKVSKFMHADDIMAYGKRFSKSFGTSYSPWSSGNDPELWMWRKTALKQAAKLAPKNEDLNKAIAFDNEESTLADKIKKDRGLSDGLTMGSLLADPKDSEKVKNKKDEKTKNKEAEAEAGQEESAENIPQGE